MHITSLMNRDTLRDMNRNRFVTITSWFQWLRMKKKAMHNDQWQWVSRQKCIIIDSAHTHLLIHPRFAAYKPTRTKQNSSALLCSGFRSMKSCEGGGFSSEAAQLHTPFQNSLNIYFEFPTSLTTPTCFTLLSSMRERINSQPKGEGIIRVTEELQLEAPIPASAQLRPSDEKSTGTCRLLSKFKREQALNMIQNPILHSNSAQFARLDTKPIPTPPERQSNQSSRLDYRALMDLKKGLASNFSSPFTSSRILLTISS